MMNRRTFLCGLTIGTLAAPLVGEAQTEKIWRVALMHVGLDHVPPSLAPLREELGRLVMKMGETSAWTFGTWLTKRPLTPQRGSSCAIRLT
jgi:hypothetical protein